MHLQTEGGAAADPSALALEDRWILSRLAAAREAVHAQLEAYSPAAALHAARSFFWSELCDWYLELVKPRMADPTQAPVARAVLAAVFDQVLRLLHPFTPFITEALWGDLYERAPVRGIGTPLEVTPLLVHAPWPAAHDAWRDTALEARVELALDVVREIRSVRSRYDVPPRKPIDAAMRGAAQTLDAIDAMRALVCHMAGLATLVRAESAVPVAEAAVAVVRDVKIELAGLIDVDRERVRLERQLDRLRKQVASGRAKLENERFISRAPQEVVDAERARVAAAESELAGVEQSLAALGTAA
jgi:valyl-tRNA synthetase